MPIDLGPLLNLLVAAAALSPIVALLARLTKRHLISGIYVTAVFVASVYVAWLLFSRGSAIAISNEAKGGIIPGSVILIDSLSSFMSLVVLGIGLVSSIYSLEYIKNRKAEFFPLLLLMVVGMVGVFSSGDMLTFFIFWEVMSLSSYILVAFNYKEWEAVEASLKYLIMSSTGSAAILFGMSLLYGLTGTLEFSRLSSNLISPGANNEIWSVAALVFIVGGLGVNAAVAPFHSWLPDAHPAAPSPISAMLSGVVIKTGIYGMFRFLTSFFPASMYGWQLGLLLLAILTMTLGNLMASLQSDIKRLLAFSSIANIGYIVFAIGIATQLGFTGGLLHVLNHAIAKGLLFLAAGSFIHVVGSRSLDDLSGIGRLMPVSGVTYAIGAFSLAGIPGLNSFVSEYTILTSAFASGFHVLAAIMLLNIVIGAMYHLRVVQILFLKPVSEVAQRGHEPGAAILTALIILSALAVTIGVYPAPFFRAAENVASLILPA